MAGFGTTRPGRSPASLRVASDFLIRYKKWFMGAAAVLALLVVSLIAWGPDMEFPTTVSTVESTGESSITLKKTVRQVTGSTIDDGVDWLTVEASWLFDSLSTAVIHSLDTIEKGLKWIPWPAMVVAVGLLAFAVGRWGLLAFTVAALLYMGFMGLWTNTIDTIALMVVAVAISVSVGLPLGVLMARSHTADNVMRPILDGMQTMPSFVYLLPGILFFGLGKPAGIFATLIYAAPPVIRLTNLGIRQVSRETVEAARSFRDNAPADADQGPDTHGPADHNGRHQPDHHDGPGHGNYSQHGRRRRTGCQRAPGLAEKRARQRVHCRFCNCVSRHNYRPHHPILCPKTAEDYGRWLTTPLERSL